MKSADCTDGATFPWKWVADRKLGTVNQELGTINHEPETKNQTCDPQISQITQMEGQVEVKVEVETEEYPQISQTTQMIRHFPLDRTADWKP